MRAPRSRMGRAALGDLWPLQRARRRRGRDLLPRAVDREAGVATPVWSKPRSRRHESRAAALSVQGLFWGDVALATVDVLVPILNHPAPFLAVARDRATVVALEVLSIVAAVSSRDHVSFRSPRCSSSSDGDAAAVDGDDCAVQVAGLVGGEEDDSLGDLG